MHDRARETGKSTRKVKAVEEKKNKNVSAGQSRATCVLDSLSPVLLAGEHEPPKAAGGVFECLL